MQTRFTRRKGWIALIIDNKKPLSECDILAFMSLHEGTGCWTLEDVRLTRHHVAGHYWGSSAETYRSHYTPKSKEEADYVKSLLREYQEIEGDIYWCTFDGIVRGHPTVNGYAPRCWKDFNQAGYFSQKEGLEKLHEIKKFWDNIESLDSDWRIKNPNRQPDISSIRFAFRYCDDSLIRAEMEMEMDK